MFARLQVSRGNILAQRRDERFDVHHERRQGSTRGQGDQVRLHPQTLALENLAFCGGGAAVNKLTISWQVGTVKSASTTRGRDHLAAEAVDVGHGTKREPLGLAASELRAGTNAVLLAQRTIFGHSRERAFIPCAHLALGSQKPERSAAS